MVKLIHVAAPIDRIRSHLPVHLKYSAMQNRRQNEHHDSVRDSMVVFSQNQSANCSRRIR